MGSHSLLPYGRTIDVQPMCLRNPASFSSSPAFCMYLLILIDVLLYIYMNNHVHRALLENA